MSDNNNPLGSLADGLQQGLAMGQNRKMMQMQMRNSQLEMQMKMAKEQFDKISHQSDQLGTQIMSGKVPDALLGPIYNQWASYQKVVNPGMAKYLPGVKDITPSDADIMKQMATVVTFGKQNGIDPKLIQSGLQDLYNKAISSSNTSPDFNKSVKDYMDTNFGTQPQTITQGNKTMQGTVSSFGTVTPITAPPTTVPGQPTQPGKPVEAPNVPLLNQQLAETKRVDELSQKFNEDKVVQGIRESLAKTKNTKALIDKNPKGDVGFIQTQLAKSAGEQRITEQDIVRFSGSTDAASRAKRALSAISEGKLSGADRKDYLTLLDVFEKTNKGRLQDQIDAYAEPLIQDMTVKDAKALKTRLAGQAMADLKPQPIIIRNPKTGERKQSLDNGETWSDLK